MEKHINKAEEIVRLCSGQISISLIQRHLRVGYSTGIELMRHLISMGVVIDHGENIRIKRYALVGAHPKQKISQPR